MIQSKESFKKKFFSELSKENFINSQAFVCLFFFLMNGTFRGLPNT